VLDYPMITKAGIAAFHSEKVNAGIRQVLKEWSAFLSSPASCHVLHDRKDGWLSKEAWKQLKLEEVDLDPSAPHCGFKSWNDFFIRRFKPGMRPVTEPDNGKVIVSCCESKPFAIATGLKESDTFWIKSQPYSLHHILMGHHTKEFLGGTLFQAFLSAKNYHRWHSPVAGTLKKIVHIPGTYYAESLAVGFDPTGPQSSQGHLAHTATRMLFFIEADNASIGLMCVVQIGMAEVSSCNAVDDKGQPLAEGRRLKKGDQIGYFQFGGSSHCLIFRPGAIASFVTQAIPRGEHGSESELVKVNSVVAYSA
jgi:phosphatidylserine decarboxylase